MADAIETATSLGQRFRRIHAHLSSGATETVDIDSQASRDLKAAMADRDTAISVLTAQRSAVEKQKEIQTNMLQMIRHRIEAGYLSSPSIYGHELSVLFSTDELNRLDLLLAYYRKTGDRITTAEFDAKLAAKTIGQFHDTAQKRYEISSKQTEIARSTF